MVIAHNMAAMNAQRQYGKLAPGIMEDIPVVYGISEIIIQAGEAMMAQANQSTQGVLSLLQ